MCNLRVDIDKDNILTAIVFGEYGEELDIEVYQGHSYYEFIENCETLIVNNDCIRLDTIWLDEFFDIVSTYSSADRVPNLWGLLEDGR